MLTAGEVMRCAGALLHTHSVRGRQGPGVQAYQKRHSLLVLLLYCVSQPPCHWFEVNVIE